MTTDEYVPRHLPRPRAGGAVIEARAVTQPGADVDDDGTDDEHEPRPRLSVPRVLLALALLAGAVIGTAAWVRTATATAGRVSPSWFAPYVDATVSPTYQFQDPAADPARQVLLGFVVAAPGSPCTPTWGGAYSLGQAAQQLNLDRRIAELRAEGSGVVVSFGGRDNTELANGCTDVKRLTAAYGSVVSRYRLTTIDLDVEGPSASNWGVIERRARALADLQRQVQLRGSRLGVWLTLPAAPDGLRADGVSVVDEMLHQGVELAGVNVMAMNFGVPEPDMIGPVEQTLSAVHGQLAGIFPRYGIRLSSRQVWNRMGATVMVGQNDSAGEQFTVADASQLLAYAKSNAIGRLSMWSLNRDTQCGTYAELGVRSDTCSGIAQGGLQFADVFRQLPGSVSAATAVAATPARSLPDNPATSPYPIWQAAVPYQTGYKVVRLGDVYQAKWYNQGQDPAVQTQYAWQTPWLLVGPVLPGDHAPTTTTLPAGTHPAWSAASAYQAGSVVLFQGKPYRAKWYNKSSSPAAQQTDPSGSPWSPLFTVPGEPSGS